MSKKFLSYSHFSVSEDLLFLTNSSPDSNLTAHPDLIYIFRSHKIMLLVAFCCSCDGLGKRQEIYLFSFRFERLGACLVFQLRLIPGIKKLAPPINFTWPLHSRYKKGRAN